MGPGITLAVIGAILTFGVRTEPSWLNLDIVGLIFMLAGAGLIIHARQGKIRERTTTHVHPAEGHSYPETDQTTVVERTIE